MNNSDAKVLVFKIATVFIDTIHATKRHFVLGCDESC